MAGVKEEQGNPIEELQAYFDTALSLVMCGYDRTEEMLSYGLSSPPSGKPWVLFKVIAKSNLGQHVQDVLGDPDLKKQALADLLYIV